MIKPKERIVQLPLMTKTSLNHSSYLEEEFFTPAIYYDGKMLPYLISNRGRLYSQIRNKFIVPYLDEGGYLRVSIRIDTNKSVFTGIHKLELMSFYPIQEPDRFIPNHKDGVKTNNLLSNLEWTTVSYNTRHALDNGLCHYIGTENSRSYLTDDQVELICEYIKHGFSAPQIATMMNLGTENQNERNKICAIIRNIMYGSSYMSISMKYGIPGMQGDYRFPEELAYDVCKIMSTEESSNYNYDDLADILKIEKERRRYFKSFVIDIFKKAGYSDARNKYPNAKRPLQVPKNHENYYLYF